MNGILTNARALTMGQSGQPLLFVLFDEWGILSLPGAGRKKENYFIVCVCVHTHVHAHSVQVPMEARRWC